MNNASRGGSRRATKPPQPYHGTLYRIWSLIIQWKADKLNGISHRQNAITESRDDAVKMHRKQVELVRGRRNGITSWVYVHNAHVQ
jgi:hypothetical protein